jgi:hypothetical protein
MEVEGSGADIIRKKFREIGKQANDLRRVTLQASEFVTGMAL